MENDDGFQCFKMQTNRHIKKTLTRSNSNALSLIDQISDLGLTEVTNDLSFELTHRRDHTKDKS